MLLVPGSGNGSVLEPTVAGWDGAGEAGGTSCSFFSFAALELFSFSSHAGGFAVVIAGMLLAMVLMPAFVTGEGCSLIEFVLVLVIGLGDCGAALEDTDFLLVLGLEEGCLVTFTLLSLGSRPLACSEVEPC